MCPPSPQDATIFWITISGLPIITMPPRFNSSTTFNTALRAWRSDFAPVQTIFPELKIRVAVFGCFSRKTKPGNCSGRYSTPGKTRTIALRSIFCFNVAEATTFSILINALPLSDKTIQHSNLKAQMIGSHHAPIPVTYRHVSVTTSNRARTPLQLVVTPRGRVGESNPLNNSLTSNIELLFDAFMSCKSKSSLGTGKLDVEMSF